MISLPLIKHYVVSVKLTMKISSFFVAFLENMNFKYTTIHTSNFTNEVGGGLLNHGFNIAVVFVDTFGMHSKSSQCNTRLGTNRNRTSKN